jgi:hypothetical protein
MIPVISCFLFRKSGAQYFNSTRYAGMAIWPLSATGFLWEEHFCDGLILHFVLTHKAVFLSPPITELSVPLQLLHSMPQAALSTAHPPVDGRSRKAKAIAKLCSLLRW